MYTQLVIIFILDSSKTRCSSMVEHLVMSQWVIGLIPPGGSTDLFLIPAWYYKGYGMCCPVCRMVHIERTLAANQK